MPLNEAKSFHLESNLTQKQQREAMESLYGLPERTTMSPTEMTFEERERMRQILAQHDAKDAAKASKDFDLNKPVVPYVYREFPFVMYHHASGKAKTARDHVERERMMAEGWSTDPMPPEAPQEIPLTAAEHAEAETINAQLRKKKT